MERRASPVVYSVDVEPIELWKEGRMYKPILVYASPEVYSVDVEPIELWKEKEGCINLY